MAEIEDSVRQVVALWDQLPVEQRSDFALSFQIIKETMGLEWMNKNFDPDLKKTSIFRLSSGVSEEEATRNYRAIDLAECIINLKDIEGINECFSKMREAENPESGLAELHIGKMLYINRWPFRFVKPQGKRGMTTTWKSYAITRQDAAMQNASLSLQN
jgi:hypothetical protein